jgi:hypothetical protein
MFRIVILVLVVILSCVNAWQSSSISGKSLFIISSASHGYTLGKRYSSLSMIANGRRPLMGGNWKLNPKSVQESINLATEVAKLTKGVSDVDVVLVITIIISYHLIIISLSCHHHHIISSSHHLIIMSSSSIIISSSSTLPSSCHHYI